MKKKHTFQLCATVCATRVSFCLDDAGTVSAIRFEGGCDGNLKAIAALGEGMDAQTLIAKLTGIACGNKATSCADQLTLAIRTALSGKN
jgi:uncharacterized protein (TIGR03905 family)